MRLLGQFGVERAGEPVDVPASTHRLVAFLALQGREVERGYASASLWLDKSEQRAGANLRSALWRLRQCPVELVTVTATHVGLAAEVDVDAADLLVRARTLIDERAGVDVDGMEVGDLARDLLPAWYDDFVELERERFRQLRLHALEALARRLLLAGRPARALDAALTALAADPLRESAHRAVIEVHLAEGNVAEAVRQFTTLGAVLGAQLGIAPSSRTRALVAAHLAGDRDPSAPGAGPARPGDASGPGSDQLATGPARPVVQAQARRRSAAVLA
ncbi:BTAD domain-containing putative transcriptional regulator [Jannaschia sp. R86511]|uniref:AfsR/SARP family transcriptional regulator n=1 Tax=Jannaschia sp. R86511 TaxID=3093853 RepID=UPI0036D29789